MPSLSAYYLTGVSLTLEVGSVFMAAQPLLLTLDVGYLLPPATPDLGRGVAPLSRSLLQHHTESKFIQNLKRPLYSQSNLEKDFIS